MPLDVLETEINTTPCPRYWTAVPIYLVSDTKKIVTSILKCYRYELAPLCMRNVEGCVL